MKIEFIIVVFIGIHKACIGMISFFFGRYSRRLKQFNVFDFHKVICDSVSYESKFFENIDFLWSRSVHRLFIGKQDFVRGRNKFGFSFFYYFLFNSVLTFM
jgi:hypothetical protein